MPAMQIWLTILASWPEPDAAKQIAGARIGGDDFFGLGERRLVAAAHHREHAVLGAGLAAGDRRIDEIEAALFCFGMKFARDRRRGGGVIDHDGALGAPAKMPFSPSMTWRKSLSLPTQAMTKSCALARPAFGVGALLPPYWATHFSALAAVRLKTVTSWPPLFFRCPAIG